jgi:hypothetical protein
MNKPLSKGIDFYKSIYLKDKSFGKQVNGHSISWIKQKQQSWIK